MKHKLSIDLEEWFHPYFFRNLYPIEKWDKSLSRISFQSQLLLDILKDYNVKATFFVVGWICDNFPNVIMKILEDGHQLGSHTYYHQKISSITPEIFKKDLELMNQSIYKIAGFYPKILRAPNFSINRDSIWSLKILKEFGYEFDSSYHTPTFHPDYGKSNSINLRDFEDFGIYEFPIPTYKISNIELPFAGGAYLRYYPYWFMRNLFKSFEKDSQKVNFYIHPWEFDKNLPEYNINFISNLRLKYNINENKKKLCYLLEDFEFEPYVMD